MYKPLSGDFYAQIMLQRHFYTAGLAVYITLDRIMSRVFLLQHLHILNGDEEDVKTLDIYSTRDAALAAVERFRALPGFKDCPHFADASVTGPAEGFYVDEYEVDQDGWSEGYDTV